MHNNSGFEIKLHDGNILELRVNEMMHASSQSFSLLRTALNKYDFVVLVLQPNGILPVSVKDALVEHPGFKKLKAVLTRQMQIPQKIFKLPLYKDVDEALLSIATFKGVKAGIDNFKSLPFMQSKIFSAFKVLRNDPANIKDALAALSGDHRIAMKILELANESNEAKEEPYDSLSKAAAFVGGEGIAYVLAFELFKMLEDVFEEAPIKLLHMKNCSLLCETIAMLAVSDKSQRWLSASAGLLHDIGSLLLADYAPKNYDTASNNRYSAGLSSLEAENKIFAFNHIEAGKMFSDTLNLPRFIELSITEHHSLPPLPNDFVLHSVIVADNFLNASLGSDPFISCEDSLEFLAKYTAKMSTGKSPFTETLRRLALRERFNMSEESRPFEKKVLGKILTQVLSEAPLTL